MLFDINELRTTAAEYIAQNKKQDYINQNIGSATGTAAPAT